MVDGQQRAQENLDALLTYKASFIWQFIESYLIRRGLDNG